MPAVRRETRWDRASDLPRVPVRRFHPRARGSPLSCAVFAKLDKTSETSLCKRREGSVCGENPGTVKIERTRDIFASRRFDVRLLRPAVERRRPRLKVVNRPHFSARFIVGRTLNSNVIRSFATLISGIAQLRRGGREDSAPDDSAATRSIEPSRRRTSIHTRESQTRFTIDLSQTARKFARRNTCPRARPCRKLNASIGRRCGSEKGQSCNARFTIKCHT